MTIPSRSYSSSSKEPSQRDLDLADLSSSDEDVEALLSGGADVDSLISAGVLDDGSDEREGWQDVEGVELLDAPVLTEAEVVAKLDKDNEWLVAHGYRPPDWRSKKGYSNAPSKPL